MKRILIASLLTLFSVSVSLAQPRTLEWIRAKQAIAASTSTSLVITTGTSTTIAPALGPILVVVNPAATLAAHTVVLPASAKNGQVVSLSFGGTITSGAVVTTLTIAPNTGQAILQASAPTSASAGTSYAYRFSTVTSKWYRLY